MQSVQFDRVTRLLSDVNSQPDLLHRRGANVSRRQTIASLALGVLGVSAPLHDVGGGSGCKNVGRKCRRQKQCCSGVCEGKKDGKRCRAHDTRGCRAGQSTCSGTDVPCSTGGGEPGFCETTTGNAPYCGVDGACFSCREDANCRPFCGPRAACVRCGASCDSTGGTACLGPEPDSCDF